MMAGVFSKALAQDRLTRRERVLGLEPQRGVLIDAFAELINLSSRSHFKENRTRTHTDRHQHTIPGNQSLVYAQRKVNRAGRENRSHDSGPDPTRPNSAHGDGDQATATKGRTMAPKKILGSFSVIVGLPTIIPSITVKRK
jgi:hypothetical protein